MPDSPSSLMHLVESFHSQILAKWLDQVSATARASGIADADIRSLGSRFFAGLREGIAAGNFDDISTPAWANARAVLEELSRNRASRGTTPTQTATFVFSLKSPMFDVLHREVKDSARLIQELWTVTLLLDKLGLYSAEIFQKSREEVIARQQEEMLELSTPVVKLWEDVLALPLIGTLDSSRTQVVMENLLEQIVVTGAAIAIIDITGVPTVDTLVAQHLLKTVSAARLMGADCIISGIRPQIAQTIVHLGVQLDVTSKASMADAFELALRRTGKMVVDQKKRNGPKEKPALPREE